jgi:hypothetical protein
MKARLRKPNIGNVGVTMRPPTRWPLKNAVNASSSGPGRSSKKQKLFLHLLNEMNMQSASSPSHPLSLAHGFGRGCEG